MDEPAEKVYGVAELTREIKFLLEDAYAAVWVEGELSNVRQPSSGHLYFTIKDEQAQIHAVMFRGSQRELDFQPADGVAVRAFGNVSVYERSGQYQVIVRRLLPGGQGALHARFEALKAKLEDEGLFAAERKRPLPQLPQHIAVVTSPTGAALRDILNVLDRRFDNLHILVAPVKVQGDLAASQIASALDFLNERGGLDVIIVGRGGGSLEDLWCFNDERVARAIARSAIPVVSAVGHETDFAISDFVADLRAPTPSSAAELVVARKDGIEDGLRNLSRRLTRATQHRFMELQNRWIRASGSYVFREPGNLVRSYRQRVDGASVRLGHEMTSRLRRDQQRQDELALRLQHETRTCVQFCQQTVESLRRQLQALNPLAVLDRGYSITYDDDGRIVRTAGQTNVGDRVHTTLAAGRLTSEVTQTHDDAQEIGR